ncbi:MAG: sialate O-acetylesterase [Lachnospiraceae bacterium]|jgi:sialate O-acetylesterase
MHGITLTEAPADWEILQQESGSAKAVLAGHFQVHPAAIEVGVACVRPIYRVVREDDNFPVVPWTPLRADIHPDFTGTFRDTIEIPAGGLYRIDTSLETRSTKPHLTWLYRGDCVLHLGVGNVFIIAGQSNSSGYGRDYVCDPPDVHVHLFRNRCRWDLACHPMNESTDAGSPANEEMGVPGVSPYLSFGKYLYEFTHMPVGLIQASLGGSPMSRWHPETGDLYACMMDRIRATRGKYAGVLWYQGCSDGDPSAAPHYYENFERMVSALRKALGYEIPFFTCQLNRFVDCTEDVSWGQIREAQRQAALRIPGVTVISTTNNAMSDGIHNSAGANLLLGEKLARQAAHVLAGAPEFAAPDLTEAVLQADGRIRLTFSHMKLGFVYHSLDPAMNGFTLEDESGEIALTGFQAAREDLNHIYLTPSRRPGKDPRISFAWQADPTRCPPTDEVTFLPPLSFYRVPVAMG